MQNHIIHYDSGYHKHKATSSNLISVITNTKSHHPLWFKLFLLLVTSMQQTWIFNASHMTHIHYDLNTIYLFLWYFCRALIIIYNKSWILQNYTNFKTFTKFLKFEMNLVINSNFQVLKKNNYQTWRMKTIYSTN